jgi:hypothetical protein
LVLSFIAQASSGLQDIDASRPSPYLPEIGVANF